MSCQGSWTSHNKPYRSFWFLCFSRTFCWLELYTSSRTYSVLSGHISVPKFYTFSSFSYFPPHYVTFLCWITATETSISFSQWSVLSPTGTLWPLWLLFLRGTLRALSLREDGYRTKIESFWVKLKYLLFYIKHNKIRYLNTIDQYRRNLLLMSEPFLKRTWRWTSTCEGNVEGRLDDRGVTTIDESTPITVVGQRQILIEKDWERHLWTNERQGWRNRSNFYLLPVLGQSKIEESTSCLKIWTWSRYKMSQIHLTHT